MSGPKSSRYTLTPEQRRILRETRERERKTNQQLKQMELLKRELLEIKENLQESLRYIDMLNNRTESKHKEKTAVENALKQIDFIIQSILDAKMQSGLETLTAYNQQMKKALSEVSVVHKTIQSEEGQIKEDLNSDISDNILSGMFLRFETQTESNKSKEYRLHEVIQGKLAEWKERHLSDELLVELNAIQDKVQEIENENFLENYYALTVNPFICKCKKYEQQYSELGETYEELVSKYEFYCSYLDMFSEKYTFSLENYEKLRREVDSLEKKCEKLEEQEYISKSMDEVMEAMGYHVIGNRTVMKKSGKKFRNELYHFKEGTAINLTYAANGQIAMELGGLDTFDRIPSEQERRVLCDDMVIFCDEFQEIEKRLKAKGVVLANRVSLLPPEEQYAQIISTSDYNMIESATLLEVSEQRRQKNKKQTIRRE